MMLHSSYLPTHYNFAVIHVPFLPNICLGFVPRLELLKWYFRIFGFSLYHHYPISSSSHTQRNPTSSTWLVSLGYCHLFRSRCSGLWPVLELSSLPAAC